MKRHMRKASKKLPMLWDESMDFEVAITPLAVVDADDSELETKIIPLPLSAILREIPHTTPPPMAA
jgi:hypothetical protein